MSGADIWRKIQVSNFRCKVANKCMDICRGIKIIPSPPSLSCESSVFVKLNLDSKKMQKILQKKSNFIRRSTETSYGNPTNKLHNNYVYFSSFSGYQQT